MTTEELKIVRQRNILSAIATVFSAVAFYAWLWDRPPLPLWLPIISQVVILACAFLFFRIRSGAQLSAYDGLLPANELKAVRRLRSVIAAAAAWLFVLIMVAIWLLGEFADHTSRGYPRILLGLLVICISAFVLAV